MLNKIFRGDCLELMKNLSDNSVDMILCDLPFGITDADWDKKIDLKKFWEQARRILKPNCSAVMFASSKFSFELINSNFEMFKYKWIWIKNMPTFFVHAKNSPMRIFEEILVFSDGVIQHKTCSNRRMKYNPQGLQKGGRFYKGNKSGKIYKGDKSGSLSHAYKAELKNYPTDVLYFATPHNTKKFHPSQKPIELLEYLIKTYSDEGETVLDATIGSGSTAVAAINTNRNFIGFESDEKYFEISQQRIAEAINENYRDSDRRIETL